MIEVNHINYKSLPTGQNWKRFIGIAMFSLVAFCMTVFSTSFRTLFGFLATFEK
jgi:hypothetical protein